MTDGADLDRQRIDSHGVDGPAARRPFSDFDPLGLSAGAPIELSAEERLAQSQPPGRRTQAGAAAAGSAADAAPGAAGL